MTQSLKIECLVTDLTLEGEVASFLVTKEQLTAGLSKKADLVDGKIKESNLPDFIANGFQAVNQKLVTLEESITDGIQSTKDYSEAYVNEKLIAKADLVDGKVPQIQLPSVEQYEGLSEALNGVLEQARRDMIERADEIQRTKADLGEDGKVVREQLPNYDKIPGLETVVTDLYDSKANAVDVETSFKESQDQLDAHSLLLQSLGSILPYNPSNTYAEGYVTLKDGSLQQLVSGNWVPFKINAINVVDASGESQQQVNYNGGSKWHYRDGGYQENERAVLDNGDIVKSTIDGNKNDPNINMTGWSFDDNAVESIADLLAIQNPKDGSYVFVKSYHLGLGRGGGGFVYDSTKANINNTGTIIAGWVRLYSGAIHFDWFGCKADGVFDDWDAINNAINSKASTAYLVDWNTTSIRTTGSFEFGAGVYRITKPILLPPYTRIVGAGNRWYFAGDITRSNTVIKPDFSDVYQFAFQSANYNTTTGQLIDVNRNYTGSRVDSKEITATHGIEISKLSIEPTSKILGGIRLVASPRSKLKDMHITAVDMGVVMNSSWSSYVDVTTQHDKTGLLIGWSCNNCEVRGYYTGTTNTTLPNNFWRNHVENAAANYGLSSGADNTNLKFGIFARYNQGTYLPNIICEVNDYSVACLDGDFVIDAIYSEKSRQATFLTYQAQVQIGNTTGGLDSHIFDIGNRTTLELKQYGQLYIPNLDLIKNLGRTGTSVVVPNNFNHIIPHVSTKVEVRKLYVNSTTGNDFNVGDARNPLKTVDAAMQRASFVVSATDSYDRVVDFKEVVIVDSATYNINVDANLTGIVKVSSTQSTKPKLVFSKQWLLENCTLWVSGIDIERANVTMPASQDGCFIASDGFSKIMLSNSYVNITTGGLINEKYLTTGILDIVARNSNFNGSSTSRIYGVNTGQDTTHAVNLVVKQVTYSGGLESKQDKGWTIPVQNRGTIVGITL